MGLVNIYEDAPLFVDGVEFSGADGNVLWNNAIFLDALTQQPVPIFPHGLYKEAHTGMPTTGSNTANVWRGSFLMRTGITNAVYVVDGAPVTTERIRIYHKKVLDTSEPGTLVYDAVWPSAGTTITVALASLGYIDGDIIEVTVQVYFPGSILKTGIYNMRNAYTENVSDLTTAYGGVPTFGAGSTVTAANLNQLSNAQDWIMNYLALVPRVPFEAGMFVLGTHKSDVSQNPRALYYGWMNKGNGQDTLHGIIDYYSFNGQEYIRVYVNNVLQYTSPVMTNGQVGTLEFNIDVSGFPDSADRAVKIEQYIPAGQGQAELALYGTAIIPSRFTIRVLEVTDTRSYFNPFNDFDVLESMAYSTLKARLNVQVTGTTNAYSRINTNANLFDRARMFRKKFGWDAHQVTSLDWVNLPTQKRIGERYIVAGKDVKIAWGGFSLTKNLIETPDARDIYEFAQTEQLTGSDKVEVKEGFFDAIEGLFVGTQYYLLGENIVFFSEYMR